MAGRLIEITGSGDYKVGPSGVNGQGLAICVDCASQDEALALALAYFPATVGNVPRGSIEPKDLGGDVYSITVDYDSNVSTAADPTTGLTPPPIGSGAGGGNPPAGQDGTAPVPREVSFSLGGKGKKITLSRFLVESWGPDGNPAPDKKGILGANKDGIEGITVPSDSSSTWTVKVKLQQLQQGYFVRLAAWAGRVMNDAPFFGFDAGEVCLMQVDGHFTDGDGWELTFTFLYEPNGPITVEGERDLVLYGPNGQEFTVTGDKLGHDYLEIKYAPFPDVGGAIKMPILKPIAAYVERVLEAVDFAVLGIGDGT
jgi:hypothetical protein